MCSSDLLRFIIVTVTITSTLENNYLIISSWIILGVKNDNFNFSFASFSITSFIIFCYILFFDFQLFVLYIIMITITTIIITKNTTTTTLFKILIIINFFVYIQILSVYLLFLRKAKVSQIIWNSIESHWNHL